MTDYNENHSYASEIIKLQQRNAELVAQVERLTEAYTKELNELAQKNYDIRHVNKSQALAEHDREVAARAGKAGFVAGFTYCYEKDCEPLAGLAESANYANKIKSGEVDI